MLLPTNTDEPFGGSLYLHPPDNLYFLLSSCSCSTKLFVLVFSYLLGIAFGIILYSRSWFKACPTKAAKATEDAAVGDKKSNGQLESTDDSSEEFFVEDEPSYLMAQRLQRFLNPAKKPRRGRSKTKKRISSSTHEAGEEEGGRKKTRKTDTFISMFMNRWC